MAQTWHEIEYKYNNHKSYDRIIKSWDGTKLTGGMVQDLLPTIEFTQTNKNGIKYYTDPDHLITLTSVLAYGGYPEDVYDFLVCGYIRITSAYARSLDIRMYSVNDQGNVYSYGDFILGGFDTFDYATPVYKDDHGTITYDMKGKANGVAYPGVRNVIANWFWSDDPQYYPNTNTSDGVNDVESEFIRYIDCPKIPIFETYADLEEYVKTGDVSKVINANNDYDLKTTDYYWIYNQQSTGKLFNGKLNEVSGATRTWHSLKFAANVKPVLYFDEAFRLVLKAPSVVCSKAVLAPGYIIDNIPEEGWTEGELEYSGPFYGTLEARIEYTGSLPDNGTYPYGYLVDTNIPTFKDQTSAENAITTGDYSEAGNYYGIQTGNTHQPVVTGDNSDSTTFQSGPALSPFVSSYVCSKNDVLNVANAFYTDDTGLLDNIKKGLELMGSEPWQALCGLSWFPFNLLDIVTAPAQTHIYFGSYKYEPGTLSINKVAQYKTPGYLNAGSIYIESLFGSYRDLAPYTTLSIYLPFHGWEQIDIAKYYKKTLNIRYYVDIYTNTYACALVASGGGKSYIGDIFSGNIGINLPITGSNMSEYGNAMLRSVLGTGAGILGGVTTGMMVGNLPGAIIGGGIGAAAALAGGMFEMSQKGAPKDHLMTKGAYSGGSAAYMPNNVIIRYDIHNLIVPKNIPELYGKPSSASGLVGDFSGFLQADTMKLNTSGMLSNEVAAIERMLKEGIFV